MGLSQSRNRLIGGVGIYYRGQEETRRSDFLDAVEEGHTAVVEALLAAGADVNAKDNSGYTALIWAVAMGHTDIVEMLLAVPDINVNVKEWDEGNTALTLAVEEGNTAIVEALLAAPDIDVNAKGTRWNNPALVGAADRGYTDIVEALLAHPGIDVNVADEGYTALIAAARWGHTAVVELLLAVPGIDVNAKEAGNTALMWAAQEGHTAVVRAIERFIAEQAMNRWIPRHRDRVGFGEFVRSTRVRRRRRNSAGDVEEYEIDRLPRRAQTFIKGFL